MDKVSKVSFNEVMIYEYVIEPRSSGGISAPPKQTISAPCLDVSWELSGCFLGFFFAGCFRGHEITLRDHLTWLEIPLNSRGNQHGW